MNRIILLFLFLTTNLFGNDWDFFQLNQKSFYKRAYFDASQQSTINEMLLDSTIIYTDSVKSYFLKKYHGRNNASCYESVFNSAAAYNIYFPDKNDADSMLIKEDTIRIYKNNSSSPETVEFVFFKEASLNQSWSILSSFAGNLFPDLRITCISSQPETIFGIIDSVKTFSLHGYNGLNAVPSFYDTIQIKLSKNYGLLKFISFENMNDHAINQTSYVTQLIGFDNEITQQGFQAPVTTDFIHIHAGDLYLWRRVIDYPPPNSCTTDYYRDSITQVNLDGDTLQFIYDTQFLDHTGVLSHWYNQSAAYVLDNDVRDVFEAPTNSVTIGCVPFYRMGFCSSWGTNQTLVASQSLNIDSLNGVPDLSRFFKISGYVLDTANCGVGQIPDHLLTLSANILQGIIEVCDVSFWYSCSSCFTLIGSFIEGDSTGIVDLPLIIKENINMTEDIKLFPVPVQEELNVLINSSMKNVTYKIFNATGESIRCQSFNEDKINVADLNSGLYLLLITDGKKIYKDKFIKE